MLGASVGFAWRLGVLVSRIVLAVVVLAGATGCIDDERTAGANGRLAFSFSQFDGCFFGCPISYEILAGAEAEMRVDGLAPAGAHAVRATPAGAAAIKPVSRCDDGSCLFFTLDAKVAGDVTIEVVDEVRGTVVDFAVVRVRDAIAVETTVKVKDGAALSPNAAGEFEINRGTDLDLVNVARGTSGAQLHLSASGFVATYSDEAVVGSRFELFGHTRVEAVTAKAPGKATVTIAAGAARRELVFRVVP